MRVNALRMVIFTMVSTLAAVAGVLSASRNFSVSVNTGGGNTTLNAIAAAVIGGTSLFGGRGTIVGALLGALVISSVQNGLALVGQTAATQVITTGLILLAAVTLDMSVRGRGIAAGLPMSEPVSEPMSSGIDPTVLARLRPDFRWGAATAAYQVEGAAGRGRARPVELGHVLAHAWTHPQRRHR